jgi:hypothetical protein
LYLAAFLFAFLLIHLSMNLLDERVHPRVMEMAAIGAIRWKPF